MRIEVVGANPTEGRWQQAWMGEYCDHLYPTCPLLANPNARQTVDFVDPLGTDICGWCVRVWKARNR